MVEFNNRRSSQHCSSRSPSLPLYFSHDEATKGGGLPAIGWRRMKEGDSSLPPLLSCRRKRDGEERDGTLVHHLHVVYGYGLPCLSSSPSFSSFVSWGITGSLADRAGGGIFCDLPSSLSASSSSSHFHRSLSHSLALRRRRQLRPRRTASSLFRGAAKAIACTISAASKLRSKPSSINKSKESDDSRGTETANPSSSIGGLTARPSNCNDQMSVKGSKDSDSSESRTSNLQWAQGKAGEDRVHVVVSAEHSWVFVGIYDGFNGPDATDYLLSNLSSAVHRELKGLLWEDRDDGSEPSIDCTEEFNTTVTTSHSGRDGCCKEGRKSSTTTQRRWRKGAAMKWEENHRRWKSEWDKERLELDWKLKEQLSRSSSRGAANRKEVLRALPQALRKTEDAFLGIADKMVSENPSWR